MGKIVLHLDMNSYFATMEQQAYPNLRGKPVGVAGKGRGERTVVAGASIEAKRLGIRSGMSTWEAEKICPSIIIIPANYDRYIFTSQRIFSLIERFGPKVEVFSIDEAFLDLSYDYSWEGAVSVAKQLKELIYNKIGSWVSCSIGISYGKTLAKLASELKKPDGLVVIKPADFAQMAATTKIEALCGIGYRLRPRLNQMGVTTIADLSQVPKAVLLTTFGEFTGSWLYNISHGLDDNQIRSFRDLPQEKSVGHSYTLPQDITNRADAKKVLLLLSERVGQRLRKKGLAGKTVSLYVRFSDFSGWAQRMAQSDYLDDGLDIYQAGAKILDLINTSKAIRLLSITVSDLVQQVAITKPLFLAGQRHRQLVRSIDRINHRFGEMTIFRGALASIKERIFKIPDGRNKRVYLPQITYINPFTKRV